MAEVHLHLDHYLEEVEAELNHLLVICLEAQELNQLVLYLVVGNLLQEAIYL